VTGRIPSRWSGAGLPATSYHAPRRPSTVVVDPPASLRVEGVPGWYATAEANGQLAPTLLVDGDAVGTYGADAGRELAVRWVVKECRRSPSGVGASSQSHHVPLLLASSRENSQSPGLMRHGLAVTVVAGAFWRSCGKSSIMAETVNSEPLPVNGPEGHEPFQQITAGLGLPPGFPARHARGVPLLGCGCDEARACGLTSSTHALQPIRRIRGDMPRAFEAADQRQAKAFRARYSALEWSALALAM